MRYQANPDVVYRPEGLDGAILFDPDTARVQAVNLTGAFIWERLDGDRSLEAICGELSAQFDEPPAPAELRADVERFVGGLLAIGFAARIEVP